MSKQIEASNGFALGILADGSPFGKSQAHEIADAITAVVINAEAGLYLLRAQSPDLERVRQLLQRIARDSKRAGGVAVGLMSKVAANGAADS